MTAEPVLDVRDLSVRFPTEDGVVHAVDGVSFQVRAGETLGVVGESGSGKSVTFLAVMGLLKHGGAIVEGEVRYRGEDLMAAGERRLRSVRGAEIAMIFQDPMTSLHPFYRVGAQIAEAITAHEDVPERHAAERAVEMLRIVGIPQPDRRATQYPHEFSGGMRQRAMIAMALALNPAILIADEPTTALDVTVQAQILELLERLKRDFGTAVVLITHDLGVVAEHASHINVMYAGRIVERASRDEIFYGARHPYTWGLLRSIASSVHRGERLEPIRGNPPSMIHVPPGCAFHPRCPYVFDRCRVEVPPLAPDRQGVHPAACLLPSEEKERIFAAEVERR